MDRQHYPGKERQWQVMNVRGLFRLEQRLSQGILSFPKIDEFIDVTTGHKLISFMDAIACYNQIKMTKEDQEDTAFIIHRSVFAFWMIPFGMLKRWDDIPGNHEHDMRRTNRKKYTNLCRGHDRKVHKSHLLVMLFSNFNLK